MGEGFVAISRILSFHLRMFVMLAATLATAFSLAQTPQTHLPDTFGGIATTRVVVRLRSDAFTRSTLRRASAVADDDALPRASGRLRALAASWRATGMRRSYRAAFANPALAEKHGLDRTFVLEVPAGTDTERLANALSAISDEVELATPDVVGGVAGAPVIPEDPQFNVQWAMHNIGQPLQGGPAGTPDADIDAPEAWAIHNGVGPQPVIVAVVDSGVSSHPEFGNNLGLASTGRIVPGYNIVVATNP